MKMNFFQYILLITRCVERGMCAGRTAPRATNFPRRLWCGPTGGDHQGPWHTHQGADPRDESQLYRVQVPPDQVTPMAEGETWE